MDTSKDAPTFHLKIWAPFRVYFDDVAYSISAENDTGPFDVLAEHKNFISLLNPCELKLQTPKGDQKIRIARGMMHVKQNDVTVFLDV